MVGGAVVMGETGAARPEQKNFIRSVYIELINEWRTGMREGIQNAFMPYFRGSTDYPLAYIVYKHKELLTDWAWYKPGASIGKGVVGAIPGFGSPMAGIWSAVEDAKRFEDTYVNVHKQATLHIIEQELLKRVDDLYSRLDPYRAMTYIKMVEEPVTIALKKHDKSKLNSKWHADFVATPIVDEKGRKVPHDEVFARMWNDFESFRGQYRKIVWYQLFDLKYPSKSWELKRLIRERLIHIAKAIRTAFDTYKKRKMREIRMSYNYFTRPTEGSLELYREFHKHFRDHPDELLREVQAKLASIQSFFPR